MIPVLLLAMQISGSNPFIASRQVDGDPTRGSPQHLAYRQADVLQEARSPWYFDWGIRSPGLVRFNRVEGLSVGALYRTRFGRVDLGLTGRLGYGDVTPNVRMDLGRPSSRLTWTASAYSELTTVRPGREALGFDNSVRGLLLGRDDGEYMRTSGVALRLAGTLPRSQAPRGGAAWLGHWEIALYGEAQRAASRSAVESVAGLLGGPSPRPIVRATSAESAGVTLRFQPGWGTDPGRAQARLDFFARGEVGTHALLQGSAAATGVLQLPAAFRLATSIEGAFLRGDRLQQRRWYLGGANTLRGYHGNVQSGSDMVRARMDLARRFAFGSLVLFGDGGWAGESSPAVDGALFSAGVGFSALDGTVRLDATRAMRAPIGWSFQFYLRGPL